MNSSLNLCDLWQFIFSKQHNQTKYYNISLSGKFHSLSLLVSWLSFSQRIRTAFNESVRTALSRIAPHIYWYSTSSQTWLADTLYNSCYLLLLLMQHISAYCMLFFFLFYWAVLFWWCTNDAHHPVWRWTFDEQWRWTTRFGGAHHPIWWCTSHCLVVHITQFGGAQWCTSPSLVVHITLFGGEHRPVWWWTSTCLVVHITQFGPLKIPCGFFLIKKLFSL